MRELHFTILAFGIVAGFTLLFAFFVSGYTLEENFETCPNGPLNFCNGWHEINVIDEPADMIVTNDLYLDGTKSVKFNPDVYESDMDRTIASSTKNVIQFYFYADQKPNLLIASFQKYVTAGFGIYISQVDNSIRLYGVSPERVLATDYTTDTWHSIFIAYDLVADVPYVQARMDYNDWSATSSPPALLDYIDREIFQGVKFSNDKFYIDAIELGTPEAGCGSGSQCPFCYDQATCENASCFWFDDICSWRAFTPPSDPAGYYATHSTFATSTAFYDAITGAIAPFFEKIENYLFSFEDVFNASSSYSAGEQYGMAIPLARGYLGIVNDFFSGFPISEIFVFFLTTLIVVGIFRTIRVLIAIVKP